MTSLTKSLLAIVFTFVGCKSYAQPEAVRVGTEVPTGGKLYHARITLTNNQKIRGVIQSVGAYSIQLQKIDSRSPGRDGQDSVMISNNEIHFEKIKDIKIRPSVGETLGGFLVGTGLGIIAGGLVGLSVNCSDCTADGRLVLIVLGGGVGGAIFGPLGAIDGPFVVHVRIDGQYANYERFKKKMEEKRLKRIKKKS